MSPMRDITTFKKSGKHVEIFKPLNIRRVKILHEVLHMHNISQPPTPKACVMRLNPGGCTDSISSGGVTQRTSCNLRSR